MAFKLLTKHVDDLLEGENWNSLNRRIKADLIMMCQERDLTTEGTKHQLIETLMDWKINAKPVPCPSEPQLEHLDSRHPGTYPHPDAREDLNDSSSSSSGGGDVNFRDLKFGDKIGSGGFKDCYRGEYNGNLVAIGAIRTADFSPADFQEIKHEINVLKQLRHENIVRFIGVCTNYDNNSKKIVDKKLLIITELCDNGDLFDYMRRTPKPQFSQLMMYMHDIALGVSYLHTRRPSVIHRDLKSMNILISADNRAKINDFGLARIRPRMNTIVHTACGTPNWQAPEFWTSHPSYTEKVDVYACGLIFWEILQWGAEPYPYHDMTEHQLYSKVRDEEYRPPLAKLQKYPSELLDLIQEMWAQEPRNRPPMTQVVERLLDYLS